MKHGILQNYKLTDGKLITSVTVVTRYLFIKAEACTKRKFAITTINFKKTFTSFEVPGRLNIRY